MDGADKLSSPYNRAAPQWATPPHPAVFAPVSRRVGFLQTTQGVTPHGESIGIDVLCIFTYTLLNYRFTRTFTDHSSAITRCWGFELQNGKRASKAERKQTPCGTKLRARIFFGAGKFASQTYPAGGIKSRGNG